MRTSQQRAEEKAFQEKLDSFYHLGSDWGGPGGMRRPGLLPREKQLPGGPLPRLPGLSPTGTWLPSPTRSLPCCLDSGQLLLERKEVKPTETEPWLASHQIPLPSTVSPS